MDNEPDLMNRPVNRSFLQSLGRHGRWSESTAKQAFYDSGIYAGRKQWLSWAVRFFAGTGVAFLLAGIIFFFAWNWADMSRVLKFGVIGGATIIFTAAAMFLRKKHELGFQLGLTVITVLIGVLFAVQGQEYQTGANDFIFFRNWSTAVLLIVAASCFPPLWLLYAVLLNVTLFFWHTQFNERDKLLLFSEFFALNVFILLVWEFLQAFKVEFVKGRWFPRILATAAVLSSTFVIVFGSSGKPFYWISATAMLTLYVAGGIVYGFFRRDLFMLGLIGFSSLIILSDVAGMLIPEATLSSDLNNSEAVAKGLSNTMSRIYYLSLLRGAIVLIGSSLLAVGLVKLNKKWKA